MLIVLGKDGGERTGEKTVKRGMQEGLWQKRRSEGDEEAGG